MPVDYSKWDALELSDDSDFESHPNVDKKSFIRAKQNQIHQQRAERKHQIETLKYERIINDGLLRRIDTLLAELRGHEAEAKDRNAFLYQALIASAGDPDDDEPPKPPAGVHSQDAPIKYSQMMGSLVDQVKKEVDESSSDDWFRGFIRGVDGHKKKVTGLQKELEVKLAELEKEETRKITSESYRDGFNSSSVSKDTPKPEGKTVEVLNPASLKRDELIRQDSTISSGAEADIDEDLGSLQKKQSDEDADIEPTQLEQQFAEIKPGDYPSSYRFIRAHPEIVTEHATDALLALAFDSALASRLPHAKACVHQALILQYCRNLGKDGVSLFFKRVSNPEHQANILFKDDVKSTFERVKTRSAELAAERAANSNEEQVEQIQLQAVEPGTEIFINVPDASSEEEMDKQARAIFESFPPGLQRALESNSLDKVNEVLGKMSVEEAEEVVGQLGDSGMLDMRQGVIDGTTEEGQAQLKQMKEAERVRMEEIPEGQGLGGEPREPVIEDLD